MLSYKNLTQAYFLVLNVCHEDFATVLENYFINKYGHIHGYKRILNTNYTELDRKTSYRGAKLLRTLDINKSLISNFEGLVPANYKKVKDLSLQLYQLSCLKAYTTYKNCSPRKMRAICACKIKKSIDEKIPAYVAT